MTQLKTQETNISVAEFVQQIDETRRQDLQTLIDIFSAATNAEPKIWGTAIIGFGSTVLKYESGRELDWFRIGLAARKSEIALYGLAHTLADNPDLAEKLGKYKTGKGCLYIKKISDIDPGILAEIARNAAQRNLQS